MWQHRVMKSAVPGNLRGECNNSSMGVTLSALRPVCLAHQWTFYPSEWQLRGLHLHAFYHVLSYLMAHKAEGAQGNTNLLFLAAGAEDSLIPRIVVWHTAWLRVCLSWIISLIQLKQGGVLQWAVHVVTCTTTWAQIQTVWLWENSLFSMRGVFGHGCTWVPCFLCGSSNSLWQFHVSCSSI